jgi:hypothetical protein
LEHGRARLLTATLKLTTTANAGAFRSMELLTSNLGLAFKYSIIHLLRCLPKAHLSPDTLGGYLYG